MDRSGNSVAFFESFVKSEIFVSKEIFWIKICLSSKKVFVSFVNFEQTIFGLLTRIFWELFSELHLPVHSNVFMKDIFFEKKVFFPNLLLSVGGIFSCFLWKFSGRNARSFFMSEGLFMENKLFEKKIFKIYGFWAICFWDLAWSFNRDAKTSHRALVLGDFFEKKHLFWKKFKLQKFFRTASEKFQLDFSNILQRFQRNFFPEKTLLFKKSCLFPVNAEIFSEYSVETFWQDVQNCFSIVQRSMIPGKNCFFENVDFFAHSDLEQILYESFVATFRQLTQNSNPSVHRNILNKKYSPFDQNHFSCLRTFTDAYLNIQRKVFCQFCQYGIQRIQRNDWMKFLSYKELKLFYHFWTLNEKSLEFLPENFVTVVKIVLACPGYDFLQFFCKNCAIFFYRFCVLIDSASISAKISWPRFAKLHSTCQRIFSRKNNWC